MRISGTLVRSAVIGIAATGVDLVVLWVLVHGLGVAAVWANVPALLLGVAVQFAGNKWVAFRDRSRDVGRQGAQFALVEVGAIGLNAIAFHLLVTFTGVPVLVCRMIATAAVYFGWSYPLWARIFAPDARGATAEE
jgi:putative flippase GtrA